jgi:hypothetical protein
MSVWQSIEALREFAYKSDHMKVFRDRAKWFEKAVKPNYCPWWIPAGHIPTVAEGASGWNIIKSTERLRIRFGFRNNSHIQRTKVSAFSDFCFYPNAKRKRPVDVSAGRSITGEN